MGACIWSRFSRARQRFYELSLKARAGIDLGFLFGLSSNSIPAVGWMLIRILNPGDKTLFQRVMTELDKARHQDETVDIPVLVILSLLQSIFHEVLRVYPDILVARQLKKILYCHLMTRRGMCCLQRITLFLRPLGLLIMMRLIERICHARSFMRIDS